MKVNQLINMEIVTDKTKIFIRDANFRLVVDGMWYYDSILDYGEFKVESFEWKDNNEINIYLK